LENAWLRRRLPGLNGAVSKGAWANRLSAGDVEKFYIFQCTNLALLHNILIIKN
jgi:hypothetical protein